MRVKKTQAYINVSFSGELREAQEWKSLKLSWYSKGNNISE